MRLSKRVRRFAAIFFILNFTVQIVAPSVSYALTAGPTAPEYTSFEPVDTTDMVNLTTGDFVYNTPILDVPGPEGGYPLSLSYHAGIKLDQESSWVGLGFSLNAGAINRTVNGFADDNNLTKREVRDYWGGGTQVTKTYSIGLSVPKTGVGINYSLARTTDTYKGFSTNSTVGVSVNPVAAGLNIAANIQAQNLQASTGSGSVDYNRLKSINNTAGRLTGGINMGVSIDSKGVKTNMSVAGQTTSQNNNYSGSISSFTKEFDKGTVPIGNFGSLTLKDFHTRYWSDENQSLYTYGALYPNVANANIERDFYTTESQSDFITYSYDAYDIHDGTPRRDSRRDDNVDDQNDPTKQIGGSLPAYDRFDVTAQGIGGIIQPHIFENGDLYGQNIYNRNPVLGYPEIYNPILKYSSLRKFTDKKVDFRFINDFSNSLSITPSQIKANGDDLYVDPNTIAASNEGFNNAGSNQKLAGSRHIDWFSNEEIANGSAQQLGFIDYYQNKTDRYLEFDVYENYMQPEACLPYGDGGQNTSIDFGKGSGSFKSDKYSDDVYVDLGGSSEFRSLKPKKSNLKKKIGGFKITNETGVTYHYALPVYSYNEYTRSKLKEPRKGVSTFREYRNDEPYAYTWLLTAITGPDYVDRNNNAQLDDEDWGYWVKFDYGRWADSYQWRTPHSGYIDDIESEYATFSYGIKELYYLDAVETRSHKAVFIKSKRKDGRGVTSRLEGGSKPRSFKMHYKFRNAENDGTSTDELSADLDFSVSPVSTMKLDAIYLFDKDDLVNLPLSKSNGDKYNEAANTSPLVYRYNGATYEYNVPHSNTNAKVTLKQGEDFIKIKYHNADLVFDDDDIKAMPTFKEKALKIIEFNTDYSLTKGVPNSIGHFSDMQSELGAKCFDPTVFDGAVCKQPETDFDFEWGYYNLTNCPTNPILHPFCCDFYNDAGQFPSYSIAKKQFYSSNPVPVYGGPYCAATVSPYSGDKASYYHTGKLTLKGINFLGKSGIDLMPPTTFSYHENPGYLTNKFDEWGYYKSDYNNAEENYTRRITPASSLHSGAWSLKSINSPLGATIEVEYEPNQYGNSVYNDFSVFSIEDIEPTATDDVIISFKEKGLNLSDWFSSGNQLDMESLIVYQLYSGSDGQGGLLSGIVGSLNPKGILNAARNVLIGGVYANASTENEVSHQIFSSNQNDKIKNVENGYIVVNSPRLKEVITRNTITQRSGRSNMTRTFNSYPYFISGFVKAADKGIKFSGGIRVKSLSVVDNHLGQSTTSYSYNKPSSQVSSGVTSFKPFNLPSIQYPKDVEFFDKILLDKDKKSEQKELERIQQNFQKIITEPFADVLVFTREAPAPGAIYEFVTTQNKLNNLPFDNYTTYNFRVFNKNMVTREIQNYSTSEIEQKQVVIKNSTIDVGNVLNVNSYSAQNVLVKTIKYGYLYDETNSGFESSIKSINQGVVEQSFHKNITLKDYVYIEDNDSGWEKFWDNFNGSDQGRSEVIFSKQKAVVTKRQDRSNAVTSIEEIDYKKGVSVITENHAFDFFSGQPLRTVMKDSYGNNFLAVSEPAYRHYEGMGLMIYNPKNKNMITQSSATFNYEVDDNYQPTGLLSSSIQTWSDKVPVLGLQEPQQNIWRKQASFQWNGQLPVNNDGTYPLSDFNAKQFNWASPNDSEDWEKTGELTLYDVYSHALEVKDINERFASTRMDPKHEKVVASTANCSYFESAYSGAEFSSGNIVDEGGVNRGNGNPSIAKAHTGKYGLLVGFGTYGFNYTLKSGKADLNKKYRASVWVYVPGDGESQTELNKVKLMTTVNGIEYECHPTLQKSKSKSWYVLNLDFDPKETEVKIECVNNSSRGVYFDDFRVHPIDAQMNSYVYDQFSGELSYMLDPNNFYTRFEYDANGRLIRTSKELLNFDFGLGKESFRADQIIQDTKYNYGRQSN